VDEEAEPGEAGRLGRFPFLSSSMRLWSSTFDTLMIFRMALVNLANSGLSGGGFMPLSYRRDRV
jgi:hypothetical protein